MGNSPKTADGKLYYFGETYDITENHFSDEQMNAWKFTCDTLGDKVLEKLNEISPPPPPRAGWGWQKGQEEKEKAPLVERDLYELMRENADKDDVVKQLWDEVTTVPEWVDWDQIKRGQEVFYRYAAPGLLGFALHSLMGATGAAYSPAETLVRTGGHSLRVTKHRFFETFQLLLEVCKSVEDVKPGGDAFKSTIRVRFLHATVRQRIAKLAAQRPGYFPSERGGIPINDLDSIHAICAFSTDLIYNSLPSQGIHVRPQEERDYIALWRWIGHIIGAPIGYMENTLKARAASESVIVFSHQPTPNSRALLQNIVTALDGQSPIYAAKGWWEAGGRAMNPPELCDALGLPVSSLYYRVLMACQSFLFKSICYGGRAIPAVDQFLIEFFRKTLWDFIIESKEGLGQPTKFDFKYIPDLAERTGSKVEVGPETVKDGVSIETYIIVGFAIEATILAGIFLFLIWGLKNLLGLRSCLEM